ncbi:hypothetical protein ANN_26562 [Periplaneta americana]|uniref:Uncharacterized protein n=1 Tax=Periplaneta americana TaxID=6978 RepID=A0ABQ8RYE9_PERAM|nr:hypothetical protein ANN_26562 [Periplaneta americana]
MAGLCEGANEPPDSLKAISKYKQTTTTVHTTIHVQWPARSPDLSPLDFFLWGTIKDNVYQNILTTPDDMQQRIRQTYVSIQPKTCRAVIRSFGERLRMCFNKEKKELVGSLAEKKLPTEGCNGRSGEREKNLGQKKISDDRRL